MKAAVISLGSNSSQITAEALAKYFDTADMLQLRNIEIKLGKEAGVYYQGKPLPYYDCIYAKGSFRYANLLRSITTMLRGKVPYMPLPADTFTVAHNKLLTQLVLQQHNIPMPRTYLSPTIDEAKELLKQVNYPIVMKFPEGTQGKGVMFADSLSSASSLLDALGALNQPFIIQEYVETGGTDVRALVVGEKVVAAMRRKAKQDEKRANLHAGGTGEAVQLSRESMNIALDTAKALGAGILGVDILEGPLGPQVIEVNVSPGLGINEVSTLDLPDEIAKFLHRETMKVVSGNQVKDAAEVMREINNDGSEQEIIAGIQLRGDKVILPSIVNKIAKMSDRKNYSMKVSKGKIKIEESAL
jgi:ribosomal protein S6--L-glutamate ligase